MSLKVCVSCRAAFKYEGTTIVPAGQGTDYEDFKKLCTGKALDLWMLAQLPGLLL